MDNPTNNAEVKYLYLDDIIPNRFQPRENFNEQALNELAVSIREHGVIQPIIVRQIKDKFEIIAGERRYKASTIAGLTKIPAIINNLDDKECSKVAVIENLQRKDLTPIEEARTYQKILELDTLTQEELANTIGKSQSAVSNKLRLLSLPYEVQDALLKEQISERHARSLLNLTNSEDQVNLLNKIISSRMTVRELDEEIKNMKSGGEQEEITNPTSVNIDSIINNSTDINEAKPVEMPNLLKPEEVNDTVKPSILDSDSLINKPVDSIPAIDKSIIEPTPIQVPSIDEPEVLDLNDKPIESSTNNKAVIDKVKNTIKDLQNSGNNMKVDEYDFEDFYQIVIQIDK